MAVAHEVIWQYLHTNLFSQRNSFAPTSQFKANENNSIEAIKEEKHMATLFGQAQQHKMPLYGCNGTRTTSLQEQKSSNRKLL